MIYIGTDRDGQTHLVLENARTKACGYQIALCGREVVRSADEATELVQCFHCNIGRQRGDHLLEQNATR